MRASSASPLTAEEARRFHALLIENGCPDFPLAQVGVTVARLLCFYRLCETAGRSTRPASAIHTPVDNPSLARFRSPSN